MAGPWNIATKWRNLEPVVHRMPLPFAIYRAIVAFALLKNWVRFAAICVIAFEGPVRIGECLRALRRDLVLPGDILQPLLNKTYLNIKCPKSGRRGEPTVQHATVRGLQFARFLTFVFQQLNLDERLYPFSASGFRSRWNHILKSIGVPASLQLVPSSLRGGGAVRAYQCDVALVEIQWRMRHKNVDTLDSYIQEVSTALSLASLQPNIKSHIVVLADMFDCLLDHYSA